ncbi:DsrE/DsrF/DrsH-like family protein, partial [Intestinimonas butyriciproducens]
TTGNRLISNSEEKGKYTVIIEKGSSGASTMPLEHDAKGKTLIMFSDDLDKALVTFVLANGAAATGQPVTIFFTFWGLSRPEKGLQ